MNEQPRAARSRNRDGSFKSAADADLDRQEAEWNQEIRAKTQSGMSFEDAFVSSGGIIVPDANGKSGRTK